jgi:choline dehydrogenase-like flavoprotein
MKRALIVGSGAGGATAAKELQGPFEVTVLEAGEEFRPFSRSLSTLANWRKSGLFFDEREIRFFFPAMKIRKTEDMVLVNGRGLGGTTTISTGNGLRTDEGLKRLGINLDAEFEEIRREIPLSTGHQKNWSEITWGLFEACREMGLSPWPTPKMGDYGRCLNCGRCILGCPNGVKWDSRQFLDAALARGTQLIPGCRVSRVDIENGKAKGILAMHRGRRRYFEADLIVLAAGGLETPIILQNSGIACRPGLFVDPVLCVAAEWQEAGLHREMAMPFIVERPGFIISPYFDYLSFFFNKRWRYPAKDILSLMIKLADSPQGSIFPNGIKKSLSVQDRAKIEEGISLCREIFSRLGIEKNQIFLGTVNGGHPGGMFPLTEQEALTFHHRTLPSNLYIADASLFPESLGRPPILTIIAMAKRVSRLCVEKER